MHVSKQMSMIWNEFISWRERKLEFLQIRKLKLQIKSFGGWKQRIETSKIVINFIYASYLKV